MVQAKGQRSGVGTYGHSDRRATPCNVKKLQHLESGVAIQARERLVTEQNGGRAHELLSEGQPSKLTSTQTGHAFGDDAAQPEPAEQVENTLVDEFRINVVVSEARREL